jgi:hypothetical protein
MKVRQAVATCLLMGNQALLGMIGDIAHHFPFGGIFPFGKMKGRILQIK